MKYMYLCLLAALCVACGHNHDDELAHHHHDHELGEAHEAGAEISLSPQAAERFGVSADTIVPSDFSEVIKVTGQILNSPSSTSVVSAPTSGIVRLSPGITQGKAVAAGTTVATISSENVSGGDRNRADRAAVEAAKRELDRLTPLYEEGIVSTKDYNAAKQAYEIALSQYSPTAAAGVAKAVSAGVISDLLVGNGSYVEAGTPIATVSSAKRLTLRADVPDRYYRSTPLLNDARISMAYDADVYDLSALNGKRVSVDASAMRVTPGYMPIYFEIDNNGSIAPGSMAEVYLLGTPRHGVITVPVEAVVEQQGKHFVFRQIDEDCYEKLPVTLGATDGRRYEVRSGLEGGECIVVTGATAVRLAESSAVVPEGHSHSH